MIKGVAVMKGKQTLFLGLSFGNLDKFRADPADTYIHVDGKEIGIDIDIVIFSGETEADLVRTLAPRLGGAQPEGRG